MRIVGLVFGNETLDLLLGPLGLLVGSLILNALQMRGVVLSRRVVDRQAYDELLAINSAYAEKFGEQTEAVKRLAGAVERGLPVAK